MSDIGYKNSNQDGIVVSYNSLDEYIASLKKAIQTPCEAYEKIGVVVDGEYRQLNTNILQIENEYYSFVHPKQIAESGETPSHATMSAWISSVKGSTERICAYFYPPLLKCLQALLQKVRRSSKLRQIALEPHGFLHDYFFCRWT